jgi:hypothetical protein
VCVYIYVCVLYIILIRYIYSPQAQRLFDTPGEVFQRGDFGHELSARVYVNVYVYVYVIE